MKRTLSFTILFIAGIFLISGPGNGEDSKETFWQSVSWTTPDGMILKGLYHGPSEKGRLTWVFLHGLGSNKEEWKPFATELGKIGQGVFIYDMRGHHESRMTVKNQDVDYKLFNQDDWKKMSQDLSGALDMLEKKFGRSINGFGVGGASVGANVAMLYAATTRQDRVKGVLLLSPGLEYAGLNIEKAFAQYQPRLLCLVASPGDQYAYQSVRSLALRRTDSWLRVMEGPDALHGVQMLNADVSAKILNWLKSVEERTLLS